MDAECKGVDFGNQDVLKTEEMFIKGAPAWRMTWKHYLHLGIIYIFFKADLCGDPYHTF